MKQGLVCNQLIKGRSDKKFCAKGCSNHFPANKKKEQQVMVVKRVNKILQKNSNLLLALFEEENKQKKKVDRLMRTQLGFNFEYMTGIYTNRAGKLYHYVYDFAWMAFSTQEILIVQNKKTPT